MCVQISREASVVDERMTPVNQQAAPPSQQAQEAPPAADEAADSAAGESSYTYVGSKCCYIGVSSASDNTSYILWLMLNKRHMFWPILTWIVYPGSCKISYDQLFANTGCRSNWITPVL